MSQEFDVNLVYYGRHRKPKAEELGAKFQPDLDKFLAECDVITINCPLTDKTRCRRTLTFCSWLMCCALWIQGYGGRVTLMLS